MKTSHAPFVSLSLLAGALSFGLAIDPSGARSAPSPEQIKINDNRTPAGTLQSGVLTIRLEAREGEWHPDRDTDPGVVVYAFGEQGKALQIPGPMIRVKEGTEIHALVRNGLAKDTLTMHGLYPRGAAQSPSDTVQVNPNETREVRFVAGVPGTYFYWAAPNADSVLARRRGPSTTLSGAIVVEPRDAVSRPERVIMLSLWADSLLPAVGLPRRARIVMNGKAWPNTERLAYGVGDTVRMRLINAGAAVHPMHLHGFYFNVDSRGDERVDTVFSPGASPRLVVTERLIPGRTFSLTWVPTRPGNWLFHCHDNVHITPNRPLNGDAPQRVASNGHVGNHALEMMGGPVMGITIKGRSVEPVENAGAPRRKLRLVARVDTGHTDTEPAYGYTLHEAGKSTPAAAPYLPGPTIVVKRGQPVSITVVNEIPEATAVHWHGIELESYFDGVAGFSGAAGKISPAIAPRDSFEARFTPPRSGTFIYHTHVDEVRQQRAGLSGALLVVDDPATYDPATDLVMLVTNPRLNAQQSVGVFLNGTATPAPLEMKVGTRYRLRWINVHTARPSMIMKVMRDSSLMTWRAVAKDGMPLPSDFSVVRPSAQQMGNGETYDFEFTPTEPGELHIDVTAGNGVLLVRRPVIVR